ncbi:sulfurtransferase TusA family protein [Methylobrevis albus]|uniref:Sulfurtransferase TusA family protein n=1 Tax=Methylobrevis albus TaxID=2793297 RepID=A0A931I0Y5_9HYPH|nr:sulfurtransferase TusA family protein [Methylobrevis albus]MBH0237241.1 sulfurtransferase TusA family protein [Methylobrevis albus]
MTGREDAAADPAVVLDLRGLHCPMPVLRARKALETMAPGARIAVEATDPLAAIDLPHFCHENGHVYLGRTDRDGVSTHLIERGA